jgi:hypothetical protein
MEILLNTSGLQAAASIEESREGMAFIPPIITESDTLIYSDTFGAPGVLRRITAFSKDCICHPPELPPQMLDSCGYGNRYVWDYDNCHWIRDHTNPRPNCDRIWHQPDCQCIVEQFQIIIDTRGTNTFTLPTCGAYPYDWWVHWGDNTEVFRLTGTGAANSPGITRQYAEPGEYRITILSPGSLNGWLRAFGFWNNTTAPNAQVNRDKVAIIIGPITVAMFGQHGSTDLGNVHDVGHNMFFNCRSPDFALAPNFRFAPAWHNIERVGNNFCRSMFQGCNTLKSLPQLFTIPRGIKVIGSDFLHSTFEGCDNDEFFVNMGFRFPELDEGEVDKPSAFRRTFWVGTNKPYVRQMLDAQEIIGNNPEPNSQRNTFTAVNNQRGLERWADFEPLPINWGGMGIVPLPFVPVDDIIGVQPSAAMNSNVLLDGTVVPPDATNQNIVWSIVNVSGGGSATISNNNNRLLQISNSPGNTPFIINLRATVPNGLGQWEDFVKENIFMSATSVGGSADPCPDIQCCEGKPCPPGMSCIDDMCVRDQPGGGPTEFGWTTGNAHSCCLLTTYLFPEVVPTGTAAGDRIRGSGRMHGSLMFPLPIAPLGNVLVTGGGQGSTTGAMLFGNGTVTARWIDDVDGTSACVDFDCSFNYPLAQHNFQTSFEVHFSSEGVSLGHLRFSFRYDHIAGTPTNGGTYRLSSSVFTSCLTRLGLPTEHPNLGTFS